MAVCLLLGWQTGEVDVPTSCSPGNFRAFAAFQDRLDERPETARKRFCYSLSENSSPTHFRVDNDPPSPVTVAMLGDSLCGFAHGIVADSTVAWSRIRRRARLDSGERRRRCGHSRRWKRKTPRGRQLRGAGHRLLAPLGGLGRDLFCQQRYRAEHRHQHGEWRRRP